VGYCGLGQQLNNSADSQTNEKITHIGRQINMGSGSTYIENQTLNSPVPQPSPPMRKKILFIAANPENEARIATDKEYRLIKAELERGSHRDSYEFLLPQFAVTIQELIRAIAPKPQIIHFAGHGERKGIIITNEQNQPQSLSLPILQRIFRPLKTFTELVLLNSCYSALCAKEISEFGMYVVGYLQPISDEAAIGFAQGLYIGLSRGKTFEEAFNDAIIVLLTKNTGHLRGLGTSEENSILVEVWRNGEKLDL
jgi:hypothetical protein